MERQVPHQKAKNSSNTGCPAPSTTVVGLLASRASPRGVTIIAGAAVETSVGGAITIADADDDENPPSMLASIGVSVAGCGASAWVATSGADVDWGGASVAVEAQALIVSTATHPTKIKIDKFLKVSSFLVKMLTFFMNNV